MMNESPTGRSLGSSASRDGRPCPWIGGRVLVAIFAAFALWASSLVASATPVLASYNNPTVTISGHIQCQALEGVESVEYRTDNGESGTADLGDTALNGRLVKFISREDPALGAAIGQVTASTYYVTLNNVPKGGTTLHLTVNCANALGNSSFPADFPVHRPWFGTSATRHVCDPGVFEMFGCVV